MLVLFPYSIADHNCKKKGGDRTMNTVMIGTDIRDKKVFNPFGLEGVIKRIRLTDSSHKGKNAKQFFILRDYSVRLFSR